MLSRKKKARPNGPIINPATKYPSTEPSPIRLNMGTAITAAVNNITGANKLIELASELIFFSLI